MRPARDDDSIGTEWMHEDRLNEYLHLASLERPEGGGRVTRRGRRGGGKEGVSGGESDDGDADDGDGRERRES